MATSNTKLTKEQKQKLNALKMACPEIQFFYFPNEFATVAIQEEFPNSKMVKVSISYCSLDEQKYRAKVGEYHAINKMVYSGEFVKVPRPHGRNLKVLAENFAYVA